MHYNNIFTIEIYNINTKKKKKWSETKILFLTVELGLGTHMSDNLILE